MHPLAIQVMAERTIDISDQRSKHVDQFSGQGFDYVITVCDLVRENCPVFPDGPREIHWSLPDPAGLGDTAGERHRAFEQTADQLATRIQYLLSLITESKEPMYDRL